MKETFGIQKNHNEDLLNEIIDNKNEVNKESVQKLFNEKNDTDVLQ